MFRWLSEQICPVGGTRFRRDSARADDRGATIVEFAIVIGIILFFLIGIFELCRFFAVEAMARASVREMQRLITVKKEMTIDTRSTANADVAAMLTTISNVAVNFAAPMISPSSNTNAAVHFLSQTGEDGTARDGAVLRPGRSISTRDTTTGALVTLNHQTCPPSATFAQCPQYGTTQAAFNQMVIDHPIFARVCYSYQTFVPLNFMGLGTFIRCVTAADYIETVGRPSREAGVTSTTHSSTTTSTSTTTATSTSSSQTSSSTSETTSSTVSTVSSSSTSATTSSTSVTTESTTTTSATSTSSSTTITTSSTTITTSMTSSTTQTTSQTSSTTQTTSITSTTTKTSSTTSNTTTTTKTSSTTTQSTSTTSLTSTTTKTSSTTTKTTTSTITTTKTSSTTQSTTSSTISSTSTSATTTSRCDFPTAASCATHCSDPMYCGFDWNVCDCQCLENCL